MGEVARCFVENPIAEAMLENMNFPNAVSGAYELAHSRTQRDSDTSIDRVTANATIRVNQNKTPPAADA